mmetsp:Transcript_5568/g.7325  ORF Transcript_5568/g.7325 Transcript_5568/m.7325 type:complete len:286 (+) Transcript_5568:107-964(+)
MSARKNLTNSSCATMITKSNALKLLWRREGMCQYDEEAEILVQEFLTGTENNNPDTAPGKESFLVYMTDYFDLSHDQGLDLFREWMALTDRGFSFQDDVDDEELSDNAENDLLDEDNDNDDDDDDDDSYIREGECELCERFILISKHHLIPKSTWPKVKTRLQNSIFALQQQNNNNEERALVILGDGLAHFVDFFLDRHPQRDRNELSSSLRFFMHQTCNVCRPCHSAVHKTHDNMVLALEYNTLGKLVADNDILKFAKWASKQRTGKYSRSINNKSNKVGKKKS